MGQDLSFRTQFKSTERTFELNYDGRAHSYVLNTGREILHLSLEIFQDISMQLNTEGEFSFVSSRDFEGSLFGWGTIKNPKLKRISEQSFYKGEEEGEEEPEPEVEFNSSPEGGVKFILGEDNPEYCIFILGDFQGVNLEPLAQILEKHTYKRVEYLGRNQNIPTNYAEWLGIKFEIKVLPVPEDLAFILSLEEFPYGNKPDKITYFGIGEKSLVAKGINVQKLVSEGKLCLWKIDGASYIYLDPSLREKVGIGIALGKVNLPSDLIFSNHNKPYQEAYGGWLKANNYRQFEKNGGIGDRKIYWFKFMP